MYGIDLSNWISVTYQNTGDLLVNFYSCQNTCINAPFGEFRLMYVLPLFCYCGQVINPFQAKLTAVFEIGGYLASK